MKIKNGYNNKETEIIFSNSHGRIIELWLNQTGLGKDTLSYLTFDELVELRNEINKIIFKLK
jgi:hypothetical protein